MKVSKQAMSREGRPVRGRYLGVQAPTGQPGGQGRAPFLPCVSPWVCPKPTPHPHKPCPLPQQRPWSAPGLWASCPLPHSAWTRLPSRQLCREDARPECVPWVLGRPHRPEGKEEIT